MGRGECLAKTDGRIPQARALGVELRGAGLELVGHLVEGRAEPGELVAALDVDTSVEAATRDRVRGLGEAAERDHDRAADDVRHEADQDERAQDAEQETAIRLGDLAVDALLRGKERERRGGATTLLMCRERAVAAAGDFERVGAQRRWETCSKQLRRPGCDGFTLDYHEHVGAL